MTNTYNKKELNELIFNILQANSSLDVLNTVRNLRLLDYSIINVFNSTLKSCLNNTLNNI